MASRITSRKAAEVADGSPALKAKEPFRERMWKILWFVMAGPESRNTVLTRTGAVLLMVCIGLGLAAYNTGGSGNILFLAFALLMATLILSGILSLVNFRQVDVHLQAPRHLRVNEPVDVSVSVTNNKRLMPSFSLCIIAEAVHQRLVSTVFLPSGVPCRETCSAPWDFRPQFMGREVLRIRSLRSGYPFGFLIKDIPQTAYRETLVLPEKIPFHMESLKGRHTFARGSNAQVKGSGENITHIRKYQQGDQPRQIHWKATARTRQLMVRQMAEDRQDGFLIVVESLARDWSFEERPPVGRQPAVFPFASGKSKKNPPPEPPKVIRGNPQNPRLERLAAFAGSVAEELFSHGRLTAFAINGKGPFAVSTLADLTYFLEELALMTLQDESPRSPVASKGSCITFQPRPAGGISLMIDGHESGNID